MRWTRQAAAVGTLGSGGALVAVTAAGGAILGSKFGDLRAHIIEPVFDNLWVPRRKTGLKSSQLGLRLGVFRHRVSGCPAFVQ